MKELGLAAKHVREKLGLSQRAAALEVDISHVHLNNIENNKAPVSTAVLEKYHDAWGIDLYMVAVGQFCSPDRFSDQLQGPMLALRDAWREELDSVVERRNQERHEGA